MIVQFQYEFKMAIVGQAIETRGKKINYSAALKNAILNTVGGEYLSYVKIINTQYRKYGWNNALKNVRSIKFLTFQQLI